MKQKIPKIDLKEIDEEIVRNRRQNLEFAKFYAEWLLKTPNKEWSRQQNKLINK